MSEEKIAVSLKYPENAEAPFVSFSAKGKLAEKMLEIAHENSIPVVENELAANILSVSEIGSMIPESTWSIVAEIFAVIVNYDKMV